ncbi:MAG TPA: hypothetical protein VGV37_06110 [Aliidongia sp.]|uniref:hypothetical protein n=1 Tax=Aliidongia sp. TaxID=1914230 RepID=UPI002DDC97B5|nr:hypothetical protein [Aliidongia sp.]HEV2674098.1 hypothetical protein [Aliidongia sp.]
MTPGQTIVSRFRSEMLTDWGALAKAIDEVVAWRPIESAPKDGQKFWGRVGDDALAMFWHEGFGEFVTGYNRMSLGRGMTFEDTGLSYRDHSPSIQRPSEWLPLPPSGEK